MVNFRPISGVGHGFLRTPNITDATVLGISVSTARIISSIAVGAQYPGNSHQTLLTLTAHPDGQIEDLRTPRSDCDRPLALSNASIEFRDLGQVVSAQGQHPNRVTKHDGTKTQADSAARIDCVTNSTPQQSWRNRCPLVACSCRCHQRHWQSTPNIFDCFLGSAHGGLYGLYSPTCNERSCARQETKAAWMSYCFPPWLFYGMISVNMSTSPLCGLRFGLSFPRLVDRRAKIFLYAKTGNVKGLIGLFQHGKASPGDVQYTTGFTALSVMDRSAIGGFSSIQLMLIGRDYARPNGRCQTAPRR